VARRAPRAAKVHRESARSKVDAEPFVKNLFTADGLAEDRPVPLDDLQGRTIVGIPLEQRPMTSLVVEQGPDSQTREVQIAQSIFKVRLADNEGRRNTASMLVKKMYSWRGYKIAWQAKQQPNRVSLVASHGTNAIATISIGFDSPDGLLVEELYKAEVDEIRATGARVCEFTKLAVDGAIRSKRVLATLFHIAYIYARRINGFTDLLIEVNPRHVRFYEQMLGFKQYGDERLSPRVNAPAVMLVLNLQYCGEQIEKFGGQPHLARVEKSLYPYVFSLSEERGIIGRLGKLS
jgi:hypothetical protein